MTTNLMQDDPKPIIAAVYDNLLLTTSQDDRNLWDDDAHHSVPRPLTLLTDDATIEEILISEADYIGDVATMKIYPRIMWIGMYNQLKYGAPNA